MTPLLAHLMETGFGGFYDGIAHLLMTPTDLLLVVGLSILAGQQGPAGGRTLLLVLPLAWLIGGRLGQPMPPVALVELISIVWFTAIGVLVALQTRLNRRLLALLACISGLLFGFGNGSTMELSGLLPQDLFGVIVAVTVIAVLVSAQVVASHRQWICIVFRGAGSWIAAAGLLALGLQFKG